MQARNQRSGTKTVQGGNMKVRFSLQAMVLGLLLLQGLGRAQDAQSIERKGAGYVFAAPGAFVDEGSTGTFGFGGGGEGLLKAGFGISADVGYVYPTQGGFQDGFGLFSPGVLYQFQRTSKVVPFVNGGYSLAFRDDVLNMVYFGGGVNYWPKKRLGLRFEVRDQFSPETDYFGNILQFRIGLLFR
jgi:hypothetical protein